VVPAVDLRVTLEPERPHDHRADHRALVDGRGHRPAAVRHDARASDVDGHEAHARIVALPAGPAAEIG
jgi:hypothetical protein